MAHYLVTAQPKSDRLPELEDLLRRRAFAPLEPLGFERTGTPSGRRRTTARRPWRRSGRLEG